VRGERGGGGKGGEEKWEARSTPLLSPIPSSEHEGRRAIENRGEGEGGEEKRRKRASVSLFALHCYSPISEKKKQKKRKKAVHDTSPLFHTELRGEKAWI